MKNWILALASCCGLLLFSGSTPADEPAKNGPVQVLKVTGAPKELFRGSVKKPVVIDNDEALAKTFPNKDVQEQIKKAVDWKKQQVLVFGWSGSGQAKLTFTVEKEKVLFHHTPGATRDFRPHLHVFALPKGMAWELVSKR